ncbi:MAG: cytochrome b N-terminal domain-containing protein [Pirellulales bacterium]|nr:cytochrome b N-terminal domain-containing protein [Pirellulales bacterium]
MSGFVVWLDERTGIRGLIHEALYERIPGGARWRYVWGSTLVFCFMTQVVTGLFLWMAYSPSRTTAWESVYYIQHELAGGWFLRGLHHFTAQAMVVLLALHLLQVVIDGAYRAPREVNFWLGLVLMLITLALALTGYLLPWDQKGYWATIVATNLSGLSPGVGPEVQTLVVGGSDYGQFTLTRFFALHAGVLPALLVGFLVLHVALFRKHGIHAPDPKRAPDGVFWPDQVLMDAVACLAVLLVVVFLILWPGISGRVPWSDTGHLGAELGAPADGSTTYSAARPEWYFLFLFQFLKLFEGQGETGEFLGAIVVPGLLLLVLFLMPILGRWQLGHRFNVLFLVIVLAGAGWLTYSAIHEDTLSRGIDPAQFEQISRQVKVKSYNPGHAFADDPDGKQYAANKKRFDEYLKSRAYLDAVAAAEHEAQRAVELAGGPTKIPITGALSLLRRDPVTQGPRLFSQHCAGCHDYAAPHTASANEAGKEHSSAPRITQDRLLLPAYDTLVKKDAAGKDVSFARVKRDENGEVVFPPTGAPNLYGFATERWIARLLQREPEVAQPVAPPAKNPPEMNPMGNNPQPARAPIAHADVVVLLEPGKNDDAENALNYLREARHANYFGNTAHREGEMTSYVENDMKLDAQQIQAVSAALAAEANFPGQAEADKSPDRQKLLATGRGILVSKQHCANCHNYRLPDKRTEQVDWSSKDYEDVPDLEGYGSREWLTAFIANPAHPRFYNNNNDRMPAFAEKPAGDPGNKLTPRELELLVRWLRGERELVK